MSQSNATPAARTRTESPEAVNIAKRARPANVGGARLKLSVNGVIPDYHLYWCNDDEGQVEQLIFEGFEYVQPSEVSLTSHVVQDSDLDNRVSRYVGKKADGSPMRAFLLKLPEDMWAEREAMSGDQADAWESGVKQTHKQVGLRNLPDQKTEINSQYRKEY